MSIAVSGWLTGSMSWQQSLPLKFALMRLCLTITMFVLHIQRKEAESLGTREVLQRGHNCLMAICWCSDFCQCPNGQN